MKHSALLCSALPLTVLMLASCAEPIDDRPKAEETETALEGGAVTDDGAGAVPQIAGTDIPRALHGRWGLVPADCTSTRGDAKGLIDIDAERVEFYESRALVEMIETKEATMISARFAFAGEGQEWMREMQFSLSDDGEKLVRTESGEGAIPEPLTYTRCETEGESA